MTIKQIFCGLLGGLMLSSSADAATINPADKVLVVYFSHSGNTKTIASMIQKQTGADILELETDEVYPEEYHQLTELAKKQITEGYRPALKNKPASIDDYQVIFVGSPCWWSTIAPPVGTFLTQYDFSGKTVIPFMTHGGSGFGHSIEDIQKLVPNARIGQGKAFWGARADGAEHDVTNWIEGLKND